MELDEQFRRHPLDSFAEVMARFCREKPNTYVTCRNVMGDAELYKFAAAQRKRMKFTDPRQMTFDF
jgi:hypothetical protein